MKVDATIINLNESNILKVKKYIMKKIIITNLIVLFSLCSQARGTDSSEIVCNYLRTATESFCKGKYKKAVKTLKSFRVNFPNHILNEEAFYGIGLSYFESGKLGNAENIFINILYLNAEDKVMFSDEISRCDHFQDKCKLQLYPEIFLNIQHEACLRLAEISFQRKEYSKALGYIDKADTLYRHFYGCGTDDMQEDLRLALIYSEYYEKVDQLDSSIRIMLPLVLEPAAFPMNYYNDIVDRVVKLLKIRFKNDELKELIETSIENIYFYENQQNEGAKVIRTYFIKFFEREIQVAPIYLFGKNYNVEEVRNYIRNTTFYKKLFDIKSSEFE